MMFDTDYQHAYHRCLTYKIFCARKPDSVFADYERCLSYIRGIYHATGGLKQIVYLAGWQYDGHDSKYPAWFGMNERLRRKEDATAHESYLWLAREAKRYNAVVSVHINMCDAYENSPLWQSYLDHDLLAREADGRLLKGGIWDGEQSYRVSKAREWETDFAKRRIDQFLEFLPIAEAGTVHIDVFAPFPSPFHGKSEDDEYEAMIAILEYWRSCGVDVTKEWFHHRLAGLVPMVYHLNLNEMSRLKYPASVVCGGGSQWNTQHSERKRHWQLFAAPEGGCLYDEAWGHSIDKDLREEIGWFIPEFCKKTLPAMLLNQYERLSVQQDADTYCVQFGDGVSTTVRKADRHLTIRLGERLLQEGGDLCIPAVWRDRVCYAYSETGCDRTWAIPGEWGNVNAVSVAPVTLAGDGEAVAQPLLDGHLHVELSPRQAVTIRPA